MRKLNSYSRLVNFGADLITGSTKTGACFFAFFLFLDFFLEELLAVETRYCEAFDEGSYVAATGSIPTKTSLGNSTLAATSIYVKSSPN